ncbi:hypothetical protein D3C80_1467030 [compost metagenome]
MFNAVSVSCFVIDVVTYLVIELFIRIVSGQSDAIEIQHKAGSILFRICQKLAVQSCQICHIRVLCPFVIGVIQLYIQFQV